MPGHHHHHLSHIPSCVWKSSFILIKQTLQDCFVQGKYKAFLDHFRASLEENRSALQTLITEGNALMQLLEQVLIDLSRMISKDKQVTESINDLLQSLIGLMDDAFISEKIATPRFISKCMMLSPFTTLHHHHQIIIIIVVIIIVSTHSLCPFLLRYLARACPRSF